MAIAVVEVAARHIRAVPSTCPVLIKNELDQVADHSAVFVVNAGMPDLAALLREEVDQRGFVVADKRAYNNTRHQSSADYTDARVQELGLPLVVNKEATYSAAAPRSFYDGIAATRPPVGVYLKDQQKQRSAQHGQRLDGNHRLAPASFHRRAKRADPPGRRRRKGRQMGERGPRAPVINVCQPR